MTDKKKGEATEKVAKPDVAKPDAFKPEEGLPAGATPTRSLDNVPANETPIFETDETRAKRQEAIDAERERVKKVHEENAGKPEEERVSTRGSALANRPPSTRDRALRGDLDAPVGNSTPGDFRDSSQHPAVEERYTKGAPLAGAGKASKGQPVTNRGATAQQSNSLQRPEGAPVREAEEVSGEDTGGADAPRDSKSKKSAEAVPTKKKKKDRNK